MSGSKPFETDFCMSILYGASKRLKRRFVGVCVSLGWAWHLYIYKKKTLQMLETEDGKEAGH